VPGVVLAAAYMLRMLQKVAYGGTRNPDHSQVKDLCGREILTLAPLLVFVFWIGLHPEPFTRVMQASVQHLLAQSTGEPGSGTAVALAMKSEGRGPKSETRNPKSEGNPKSEIRNQTVAPLPAPAPRGALAPTIELPGGQDHRVSHSDFGLRISFGFRPSDFGFRGTPATFVPLHNASSPR